MSSHAKEVNPMGEHSEPLTVEERLKRLERVIAKLAGPPQPDTSKNDLLDEIRDSLQ
jgi:hypothetical protein